MASIVEGNSLFEIDTELDLLLEKFRSKSSVKVRHLRN